jgi:hypothetical protein
MEMEKGIFVRAMEKLFGQSWKTSMYGCLVFLSGSSALIMQMLTDLQAPKYIVSGAFLFFGLMRSLNTKDSNVVGRSDVPAPPPINPSSENPPK